MPRQVGSAYVEFGARTGKLVSGMEEAKRATREAAREMRANINEAKGSMALLGEEVGVHLPRHLRTFLAELPGVAPALAAAFNGAAIVGLGMIAVEQAKKIYEAWEKMEEVPKKIAEGFETLNATVEGSKDKLIETNDALRASITLFQTGIKDNGIKAALDAATVSAVGFEAALIKDYDAMDKLMKEQHVNWFAQIMGTAGTDEVKDNLQTFTDNMKSTMDAANDEIRKARDAGDKKALDAKIKDEKDAVAQRYKDEIAWAETALKTAQTAQQQFNAAVGGGNVHHLKDQTANVNALTGAVRLLKNEADVAALSFEGIGLAEEKATETGLSAAERLKKAQEERMRDIMSLIAADKQYADAEQRGTDELTATWIADQHKQQEEDKHTDDLRKAATAEYIKDQKEMQQVASEAEKTTRQEASDGYQAAAQDEQLKVEMAQESNTQRIANLRTSMIERENVIQQSFEDEAKLYDDGSKEQLAILREAGKEEADFRRQMNELTRDQMNEGVQGVFAEMERRAEDTAGQIRDVFSAMINGINDQLVNMMTGKRTNWKSMFSGVASTVARSALTFGEGMIAKGFGADKLGASAQNPMWTRSADNLKKAGSDIASVVKGTPDASTGAMSGTANSVGGFFGSMLSALIPHATGGPVMPGRAYLVGERGPEPFFPGVSGTMGTNASLRSLGNVQHGPYYVDARGASDPAAVHAAVHRAMRSYIPTIVGASAAYQKDEKRRTPATASTTP